MSTNIFFSLKKQNKTKYRDITAITVDKKETREIKLYPL